MSLISPFDSQQLRCLELLTSGVTPEQVAAALGISVSLISQYCSEDTFAQELSRRRFGVLQKHNSRDNELDSLEDTLIAQLKKTAPLIMRPMEIARVLQVVNNAKRRGLTTPTTSVESAAVIRLTLPVQIVNRFSVNINNQVISTGESSGAERVQDLITIQSGSMGKLISDAAVKKLEHTPVKILKEPNEHARLKTSSSSSDSLPDFGFA